MVPINDNISLNKKYLIKATKTPVLQKAKITGKSTKLWDQNSKAMNSRCQIKSNFLRRDGNETNIYSIYQISENLHANKF